MDASRADIKRHDPVWVWDGCWLPAVVADVLLEPGKTLFVVQCDHGVSAPVSGTNIEPRNPGIRGAEQAVIARARRARPRSLTVFTAGCRLSRAGKTRRKLRAPTCDPGVKEAFSR
jgi:hypothetical protein